MENFCDEINKKILCSTAYLRNEVKKMTSRPLKDEGLQNYDFNGWVIWKETNKKSGIKPMDLKLSIKISHEPVWK